jgi:hypothetical protein
MINDVTTTTVASGAILFVIIAWMTIHFGRNPRNGVTPPKDNSDVNIITKKNPSDFSGRKNPQHAFLRRGSKAVGLLS